MPRGQKGADKDTIINSEDETIFDGCSVERGHQACLLGQSQSFFLKKLKQKRPNPNPDYGLFYHFAPLLFHSDSLTGYGLGCQVRIVIVDCSIALV